MNTGEKFVVVATIASMLTMTGCGSTLFFPAKPAEKAADSLIDDIWPDATKPVVKPAAVKDEAKKS